MKELKPLPPHLTEEAVLKAPSHRRYHLNVSRLKRGYPKVYEHPGRAKNTGLPAGLASREEVTKHVPLERSRNVKVEDIPPEEQILLMNIYQRKKWNYHRQKLGLPKVLLTNRTNRNGMMYGRATSEQMKDKVREIFPDFNFDFKPKITIRAKKLPKDSSHRDKVFVFPCEMKQ